MDSSIDFDLYYIPCEPLLFSDNNCTCLTSITILLSGATTIDDDNDDNNDDDSESSDDTSHYSTDWKRVCGKENFVVRELLT